MALIQNIVVYQLITKLVKWEGWQRPAPGDFLLRRGGFHHYDLWMLILRLTTGVMTAIVRFFITIAVALITLTRADVSPLPAWIERYLLLDTGSKSFQSLVKVYHHFNNPIFRVACWILTEDSKLRRHATGNLRNGLATVRQLCGKIKWEGAEEEQRLAPGVESSNKSDTSETAKEIQSKEAKDNNESESSNAAKETEPKKQTQVTVRSRRHSGLGVLRWRLAIMLHHFPRLRYHRAHYLAQKHAKAPHYWKTGAPTRDAKEPFGDEAKDESSEIEVVL